MKKIKEMEKQFRYENTHKKFKEKKKCRGKVKYTCDPTVSAIIRIITGVAVTVL